MKIKGLRELFRFKGYVLDSIHFSADAVQANLRLDERCAVRCPHCRGAMKVRRKEWQSAHDLPLGPAVHVLLVYPAVQGYCRRCYARSVSPPIAG